MKFSELFPEYRVFDEKDRVRKNSRNDYDLPQGWVFIHGQYVTINDKMVWTVVYAALNPAIFKDIAARYMSEGRIGSVQLVAQKGGPNKGKMCAIARSENHIGSYKIEEPVTEIPDFEQEYKERIK